MSSRSLLVYLALLGIAMAQDTRRRPDLTCENVRLKEIHDVIKYQTDVEVDAVSETNKDLRDINDTIKEQTTTHLEISTMTIERLQSMETKIEAVDTKLQSMDTTLQSMNSKLQSMDAKLLSMDSKLDAIQVEIHNGFQGVINLLSSAFGPQHDCSEVPQPFSGVYRIQPLTSPPFNVYCDKDTDYGGWTVIQRRKDGSVDFYLYWDDYKRGFGDLNGEFWLGNDHIHQLTRSREYKLRVDLEDFDGNTAYAIYSNFSIDDETNKYKLHIGNYSGDAGDSMTYSNGMFFNTRDRDNDGADCSAYNNGAWWYRGCTNSNLNGQYLAGQTSYQGVVWWNWKNTYESLKHVEMKIRPVL